MQRAQIVLAATAFALTLAAWTLFNSWMLHAGRPYDVMWSEVIVDVALSLTPWSATAFLTVPAAAVAIFIAGFAARLPALRQYALPRELRSWIGPVAANAALVHVSVALSLQVTDGWHFHHGPPEVRTIWIDDVQMVLSPPGILRETPCAATGPPPGRVAGDPPLRVLNRLRQSLFVYAETGAKRRLLDIVGGNETAILGASSWARGSASDQAAKVDVAAWAGEALILADQTGACLRRVIESNERIPPPAGSDG